MLLPRQKVWLRSLQLSHLQAKSSQSRAKATEYRGSSNIRRAVPPKAILQADQELNTSQETSELKRLWATIGCTKLGPNSIMVHPHLCLLACQTLLTSLPNRDGVGHTIQGAIDGFSIFCLLTLALKTLLL